ncbi:hypothetical protein MSP8886_01412 [Marinomonas spartinae]|uniref:Uncharacterized protein n=2 Tax=Marinomonas spartinae TaxID=1792290 RepID=A0A1A8TAE9_9GAMM|nr:hypothetical protein MSP8886_01412 [Marinomonas spartinae]
MIQAILMVYVFMAALIVGLFNDDLVIRAFASAACFGAGQFSMYFINLHVKKGG